MEVILTQDIDRLGKAGERVKAKDGYCRNYLIPNRLAVSVTQGGIRFLEAKKRRAEEKRIQEKQQAEQIATKLEQSTCVIKAKVGAEWKLFGSVTRQHVYEELQQLGFDIDKKKIELVEVIHKVGEYSVPVRLHFEVKAQLKVIVTEA